MSFYVIEKLISLKERVEKVRMFRYLLKLHTLSYFEHQLWRRLEAEDSQLHDSEIIKLRLENYK
jgi:hypothetical protein